ncbi:MAG: hypothetical protein Q9171_003432 [Xanthocarpia ochracea]
MRRPQQRFPIIRTHIIRLPRPRKIQLVRLCDLDVFHDFARRGRDDIFVEDVAELAGGVGVAGDGGPVLPDYVGPAVQGGEGLACGGVLFGGVVVEGDDCAFGAAGDEEVVVGAVGAWLGAFSSANGFIVEVRLFSLSKPRLGVDIAMDMNKDTLSERYSDGLYELV